MLGRTRPIQFTLTCAAVATILAAFVAAPRPATSAAHATSASNISLDGLVGLLGSPSSMGVAPSSFDATASTPALPALSRKGAGCGAPYGWLRTKGVWIVEAKNPSCKIRLTGATWYGMQSTNWVLAGLNFEPYQVILKEIHDFGFNSIRIPLSDELVKNNKSLFVDKKFLAKQKGLPARRLHPLELLDRIVTAAQKLNLMIILDNHFSQARAASLTTNNVVVRSSKRRSAGAVRHASAQTTNNTIWDSGYTEKQWIADWVTLTKRYRNNPTVIGFDLRNEPHTNWQHHHWKLHDYLTAGATWGSCIQNKQNLCGNQSGLWKKSSDWVSAAEKAGNTIQSVNPRVLLFVEGVQLYPDPNEVRGVEPYWWGSILKGVATDPIHFNIGNQLVYSPHEWGPWKCCGLPNEFDNHATYASITKIFHDNWGYILTDKKIQAPIWLGEFNTCNSPQLTPAWGPKIPKANQCVSNKKKGTQGQWFQILLQYLQKNPEIGWSYYPLNGTNALGEPSNNSILAKYWLHPKLPALMDALKTIETQPAG